MKLRLVFYIVLESLLIAFTVFFIFYNESRLHTLTASFSINEDVTLNRDVILADCNLELSKGTVVHAYMISSDGVTFEIDEYPGRVTLNTEYFAEGNDLDKMFREKSSEAQKRIKNSDETNLLKAAGAFVIYLLIASLLTWIGRNSNITLIIHRLLCGLMLIVFLYFLVSVRYIPH